jgi:hypothetical protein
VTLYYVSFLPDAGTDRLTFLQHTRQYQFPGAPFSNNLNAPDVVYVSSMSAVYQSTITINGDVTIRGAAGSRVPSSNPYTRTHLFLFVWS